MAAKVLIVIHAKDTPQILRNVRIAASEGADGVFLIGHGVAHHLESAEWLTHQAELVAQRFPRMWLGVNYLGYRNLTALIITSRTPAIEGIWTDNAMIHPRGPVDVQHASQFRQVKAKRWPNGMYFGGFAFKYQHPPDNLAYAAHVAKNYIDVITTSGDGTGQAADVEKIHVIRGAIGSHPLAVASGVTPENVIDYKDLVDYILVATGVSKDFHELDWRKVRELVRVAHA